MTAPLSDPSLATIGVPPQEVLDALVAGVVRIHRRVEIYESDAVTPFDIDRWNARLVSGSVSVDRDRAERRTAEFVLENGDRALVVEPYDGFWYDKILKPFWGIKYDDANGDEKIWETQLGEFLIDRIDEGRFPNAVKVTCRDMVKRCMNSKLAYGVQFSQQYPIEEMIRALAANSGITKFALPYTGAIYKLDLAFERGTDRWKIMKNLADSVGYEVYFRNDGYLTMRTYPDPSFTPLSWSFTNDSDSGTLVDYSRSTNDSRIKNHIIVVGATTEVDGFVHTVFAEVKNENPSSPTRIERIGDRVDHISNDYFTDDTQALAFANTLLRIAALEEYEVSFSSMILPFLEAGDIIDVHDFDGVDNDYIPRRFLFSNFQIPMGLGVMSGTARRVTIVGASSSVEIN